MRSLFKNHSSTLTCLNKSFPPPPRFLSQYSGMVESMDSGRTTKEGILALLFPRFMTLGRRHQPPVKPQYSHL